MTKAQTSLRKYVKEDIGGYLQKTKNVKEENKITEFWKDKFKDIVNEMVTDIIEQAFYSDKKIAKETVENLRLPQYQDDNIKKMFKEYFSVYFNSSEEVFLQYFIKPLEYVSSKLKEYPAQKTFINIIVSKFSDAYYNEKDKFDYFMLSQTIKMHARIHNYYSEILKDADNMEEEDVKYFTNVSEENLYDLLRSLKNYFEGLDEKEQLFDNYLTYSYQLLKEKFDFLSK